MKVLSLIFFLTLILNVSFAQTTVDGVPEDNRNFDRFFMPGLGYTYYQPKGVDSIGRFSGVSIEYLIYAGSKQNDESGPSHVRFYAKLNILNSDKEDISSMFMYTMGLDLSLEKNPKREFLIPYFGLEFGGLSQKQLGGSLQFAPTLGVHILAKKNLFIGTRAGYVCSLSDFETLQGWFGQATVNFVLW